MCPGTKLDTIQEILWVRSTLSLLLLQGPLRPGVAVPSMSQIYLFANYLYLIGLCAKKKEKKGKDLPILLRNNYTENLYYLEYEDYCLHLYCYTHSILVDVWIE